MIYPIFSLHQEVHHWLQDSQSLRILINSHGPSYYPFSLAPSIAISEILSNAEEFCLRTIKLKFTTKNACRYVYFAIQPPLPVNELDGEALDLINSWKNTLVEGIPHFSRRPTPRKMLFSLKYWRRLDQLFSTIEGYDIPTSGYLHVCGFLLSAGPCVLICRGNFEGLEIAFCNVRDWP